MKQVSKTKYDNVTKSYWQELFIILIVTGIMMIASSFAYVYSKMAVAVFSAFVAMMCIILGIVTMVRLRSYQKNYEPKVPK